MDLLNRTGKQNFCQAVVSCFFITVVSTAANKYDPIYFTKSRNEYELIYDIEQDATKEHYIVQAPNKNILLACPSSNKTSDLFEVRKTEKTKAIVVPLCEKSITPHVLDIKWKDTDGEELMIIGYLIQDLPPNILKKLSKQTADNPINKSFEETTENSPENRLHQQLISEPTFEKSPKKIPINQRERLEANQIHPNKYDILELMVFKYDDENNRIKFVWHIIGAGKLLTPQISSQKNEPYQTNKNIYDYDIDPLYSASEGIYVKVQLVPEEDFVFDHMKSGSRQNILTAPMRHDLHPQWQELEIFIRKVAQVIDAVIVMTGICGTLTQPADVESLQQPVYLHDRKYPIPRLFWKAVSVDFTFNHVQYRNGIIFVLHNVDPSSELVPEKICPHDDLSKTEWRFPTDNKFKHLMYACLWNEENMEAFEEYNYLDIEVFDLNDVPTIRIDENGREFIERINVIQRIDGILYTAMRYFVDAFRYPLTFISSYYHNKNK